MRSVQVEAVESFSALDADVAPRLVLNAGVGWDVVKVFSTTLGDECDAAIGDAMTAWLASNDVVLVEVVVTQSSRCMSIVLFSRRA